MTEPAFARMMERLEESHSRRQVLGVVGKGVAVGAGAALVARPLGVVDTHLRAAAQGSASVTIVDFAFNPGSVTVDVGGIVTWTNQGPSPHTVTADGGGFDSGQLDTGGSFSYTFATAGTYAYHCAIHPDMVGSVVVGGGTSDTTPASDTPAATELPATGTGSPMESSSWLGAALADGVAAWLLGRKVRNETQAEE
jgi:plastocyanin